RARWGRVRERFANEVSVARSGFVSTTGAFGRPVRMPVLLLRQTGESCDLFHFLQGQDTSWVVKISRPVRLPSGLERLATRPPATTSLARKTTGMVLVTALTALATRLPPALTMMSGLRPTNSFASPGRRS